MDDWSIAELEHYQVNFREDPDNELCFEEDIVWVEDPTNLRYVRETDKILPNRAGRPGKRYISGRLVAYSTLKSKTPSLPPKGTAQFRRRVWFLTDSDFYDGGPAEAVDPKTIKAGQPSESI
jgi:hypothetical protein